jgi:hypothetical protein
MKCIFFTSVLTPLGTFGFIPRRWVKTSSELKISWEPTTYLTQNIFIERLNCWTNLGVPKLQILNLQNSVCHDHTSLWIQDTWMDGGFNSPLPYSNIHVGQNYFSFLSSNGQNINEIKFSWSQFYQKSEIILKSETPPPSEKLYFIGDFWDAPKCGFCDWQSVW